MMTLAAGDYYVNGITLKNGATLIIDASSGPVNLYLEGGAEAKNGSSVNILGQPTDFSLFSNGTDSIILKNNGTFKGMIYAPYAFVQVMNSADMYGLVWADYAELKNSGDVYIDEAISEQYMSDTVSLAYWKLVRN